MKMDQRLLGLFSIYVKGRWILAMIEANDYPGLFLVVKRKGDGVKNIVVFLI